VALIAKTLALSAIEGKRAVQVKSWTHELSGSARAFKEY